MDEADARTAVDDEQLDAAAFGLLAGGGPDDADGAGRLLATLRRGLFDDGGHQRIGRYVVTGELGQGGMGVVYRASDPQLGRDVAIKVLLAHATDRSSARDGDTPGRGAMSRMLREAQALARIEHPNVVQVFDVGTHDPGGDHRSIYLVMELVEGESMTAWLRTRRSWREVATAFVAAARGLAAAHARGVIHRDFKPGNAIVDRTGVVRVLDFGLARSGDPTGDGGLDAEGPAPSGATLTRSDFVVGTPAYMAPEQHRRGPIDQRADQYALCVSLYEGLFGTRPFRQPEIAALEAAKRRGLVTIPNDTDVPNALIRVVQRGLSPEPAARFPDMAALADAIEHASRRRGRWGAAVGALAVTALGVVAWRGTAASMAASRCEREAAALAAWDDSVLGRIEAGFTQTGVPYAEAAAPRVIAGLREHQQSIATTWAELCTADDGRLDAQLRCLEARRHELATVAEELTIADASTITQAVGMIDELTPIDSCRAPDGREPPPRDARHLEAQRDLVALQKARSAGRSAAVRAELPELVARAEALGDARLLARVRMLEADCELDGANPRAAEAALEAAALGASTAGADDLAAEAWFYLAFELAHHQGRIDDARRMLRHGEAALADLEYDVARQRDRWVAHNAIELAAGDFDASLAAALESHKLGVELWGPDDVRNVDADSRVAVALRRVGRIDESIAMFQAAIERVEAEQGPDHPNLVMLRGNLGASLVEAHDLPGAQAQYARVLALLDAHGDHRSNRRVNLLQHMSEAFEFMGDADQARASALEALAILQSRAVPDPAAMAGLRLILGKAHGRAGDHAAALREHQLSLELQLSIDPRGRSVPVAHRHVAVAAMELGRFSLAIEHAQRAIEVATLIHGESHLETAANVNTLGRVQRRMGQADQAVATLTRALRLRESLGASVASRGWTELELARARADTGEPRGPLDAIVRDLLVRVRAEATVDDDLVTQCEQWLATPVGRRTTGRPQ